MNPTKRDPLARLDDRFDEWFQEHPVKGMIILTPVAVGIVALIVAAFRACG